MKITLAQAKAKIAALEGNVKALATSLQETANENGRMHTRMKQMEASAAPLQAVEISGDYEGLFGVIAREGLEVIIRRSTGRV
jgi:hypothetical protein